MGMSIITQEQVALDLIGTIAQVLIAAAAVIGLIVALVRWIVNRAKWTQDVDSDRSNFKTFMERVDSNIEELRKDVQEIFKIIPLSVTSRRSPERLTELGERVSTKIAAKAFVSEVASSLLTAAKGMQPFEIHRLSRDYIREEFFSY